MKSAKLWIGVVVFLMLINCGILGLLWYKSYRPARPQDLRQPVFEYLTKELKLNTAQTKQYDAMRKAHFELTSKLNNEMRMTRDSFFDQLKNPEADPLAVNAMAKKISAGNATIDTATFYHFRRFRTILDTGQQKHFDEIISNVLHMMTGPHGRPAPGGANGAPGQQMGPPLEDNQQRQRPPRDRLAPGPGDDKQLPPHGKRGPDGRPRPFPPSGHPQGPPPDGAPDPNGPPPPGAPRPEGPPPGGPDQHGPPPPPGQSDLK